MSNTNTQSNKYIGCNTRGYIQGIDEGAGFEENSVYTEPMHNGLVDIPSNEWHFTRFKLEDDRGEFVVFSNDKVGMSLEDLKNMQIMANYKGARAGITGLYGVGLVALRSKICGETGRVYHMSLPVDVENEYSTVDDFMTDMQDGLTNKDKLQAINYNMTDVMNDDTRIRHPEDLPSTAKKIWKACSINPLKKGTVLAYQCTENHSRFLDEQERLTTMDHNNMKHNLLFSAQDILSDDPERPKRIKFNGAYLKRQPSLQDYLEHVGGVQTWDQLIEVKHKSQRVKITVPITRTENISIHNITEVSPEYMIRLGVTDIPNVLPFIIEKEGEKPYMLNEINITTRQFASGIKKIKLNMDKRVLLKIIKEMKEKGAYTEEHKAVAVMDTEGYYQFIKPIIDENGLKIPTKIIKGKETVKIGYSRRYIYGNKKRRSGVFLKQEWDELFNDRSRAIKPGFQNVQNIISWEGSPRGDKLHDTKMAKFKLGAEDKNLKRVHDFIQYKENYKLFGGMVKKLESTTKNTLKFTMDIEDRYNIKKGQNFHIMKDGEVKQVRLRGIQACSGKTADILVTCGVDIIELKYDERGLHYNTLGQAIKAYNDSLTTPHPQYYDNGSEEELEELSDSDGDISSDDEEEEEEEEEIVVEQAVVEQAVVEEEQVDIHSPGTPHRRQATDVQGTFTRAQIFGKLDFIQEKNVNNELTDESKSEINTRLGEIYTDIIYKQYPRSEVTIFLIDAIERRESSLQNRIDDLKQMIGTIWQTTERVFKGVEIDNLFQEITQ